MAFFSLSRTDIQHRLSCRFLANKKTMFGIFVPSLLAMMIVPLCYSSTLIDRHHPDGHRVKTEINDEKTRNNTLTMAGGKLAGNADFPGVGKGGFFYSPPPPWGGGGGRPSGLFEIDLTILQPVISWLMSTGKGSGDGRQEVNEDDQPSGSRPTGSNDATNQHQQEKREAPEDRENKSPGEGNNGSGDGNNRKDDNGSQSKNNASTQDLQLLANELLAIIESDAPNADFKFREMLDKLDMPQRLRVLETKCTKIGGSTMTPLEAILALPRYSDEHSTRNRFIQQLIAATDNNRMMVSPDISHLMILYKIVLDIIDKVNESHQQPPIGHFEKRCFTEYFVQLFQHYSHPVERIRNLLEEISDLAIRNEIINDAQSLISPISFLDFLTQCDHHPSFLELIRLSNELRMQNDYIAINAFSDNAMSVDKEKSTHIIHAECAVCQEPFVRSSNMVMVKTPCNHLYHVDCLNQWLKKRRRNDSVRNCPTCRTELNALSKKLNDFNILLKKYDGCHSLAVAERAVKEWNKVKTNYERLYHFVQFCRHSSQAPDDSKFVKLLRTLIHPVTKAEIPHDGKSNLAFFSINNIRMVNASSDGTVKIYVYQADGSWKEELSIRHHGTVKSISCSADSSRVLTTSNDGTAKIHVRKEDGSWQQEMIISHDSPIHLASFSADSSRVLTASNDGTAKIHHQKEDGSWKEEGTISHDGLIHLARFSTDGSHVVTVGKDNLVKITGKSTDGSWQVKFIVLHEDSVNSATFSSDNRYVLTASNDGTAKIIGQKDDKSWEEEFIISHICLNGGIRSAAFSPDSQHVLTVGDNNRVKIIGKRADGSWLEKAIIFHSDPINSATFSPDSHYVMTTSDDHTAKIYGEKTDVLWAEEITIHHNHSIFPGICIFSPDSQHAVITSGDGRAKIYSRNNDGSWEEGITIFHYGRITWATFSPDRRFVMTSGYDCVAKITPLKDDGSRKKEITIRHPYPVFSASFSADSRFVLTLSFLAGFTECGGLVKITELWKEE
ncbi:RING finger domain-containing protein [Endozoicomonas sp. 4G]|uniref:RING finger domain-containing protein n=1 Tax=Endozoicomonas sp. 4G TaxID=2872754 RepID=UPI0020787ABF|nr:RING finger domain-containing protein [Endozoicomonas sp. 4G]